MKKIDWWNQNEFLVKVFLLVVLAGSCAIGGYWLANVSNKSTPQNLIIHNPASTPEQVKEAKKQRTRIWIGNFMITVSTLLVGLATLYVFLREHHEGVKLLAKIAENTEKMLKKSFF